jgi:hypothetical protein
VLDRDDRDYSGGEGAILDRSGLHYLSDPVGIAIFRIGEGAFWRIMGFASVLCRL